MKSFLISENRETFLGMKLAGIQGVYVKDQNVIRKTFKNALKNKDIGIIYLTEKAYFKIEDEVLVAKQKNLFPLITIIPDRHGYEKQQGVISRYIKESVGL